jgi:tetratricopeptide (TPR) repeat protein
MNLPLRDIRNKLKEGKIQEALSLIKQIEQEGPLCPAVLVLKGYCIQLDDETTPYELSDAEEAFKRVIEMDEDYTPAIVELAWFYLNVLDDAERAAGLFERAAASYKKAMTEAVVGKAKCLIETETRDAAKSYLAEITRSCLDSKEIGSRFD